MLVNCIYLSPFFILIQGDEEFEDLCFDFGIELDEVVSLLYDILILVNSSTQYSILICGVLQGVTQYSLTKMWSP